MANSRREKEIDFAAMIASDPFQCGVADVMLGGVWTNWDLYSWDDFSAGAIYETGRLATVALGRPCRTFGDYIEACMRQPFPPNRPR